MAASTSRAWWYLFPQSYAESQGSIIFEDPNINLREWFKGGYCSLGYGPLDDLTGKSPGEIEAAVGAFFSERKGASDQLRRRKTKELTDFHLEMSVGDVVFTSPKGAKGSVYAGRIRGPATWHANSAEGHQRQRPIEWLNVDKPLDVKNLRGKNDSRLLFELNDRQRGLAQVALHEADLLSKLNDNNAPSHDYGDEAELQPYQDEVDRDPDAANRETVLRAVAIRRGQTEFRRKLLDVYGGRCAMTGCDVEAALEAAHIVPHSDGGSNEPDNGLLLRADLHTLFDLHLLTVTANREVSLHPSLRTASSDYANLQGCHVRVAPSREVSPDGAALAKHRARCDWAEV